MSTTGFLGMDEGLLRAWVRELVVEAFGGKESDWEAEGLEGQIDSLREELALSGVETPEQFVEWCLEVDGRETFTTADVQALARNRAARRKLGPNASAERVAALDVMAGQDDTSMFMNALRGAMDFVERRVPKAYRGRSSHGTHPFANSGAGGSGFDNIGGFGTANSGGGPGAISGKRPLDPSRDLVRMGVGKRK